MKQRQLIACLTWSQAQSVHPLSQLGPAFFLGCSSLHGQSHWDFVSRLANKLLQKRNPSALDSTAISSRSKASGSLGRSQVAKHLCLGRILPGGCEVASQ